MNCIEHGDELHVVKGKTVNKAVLAVQWNACCILITRPCLPIPSEVTGLGLLTTSCSAFLIVVVNHKWALQSGTNLLPLILPLKCLIIVNLSVMNQVAI